MLSSHATIGPLLDNAYVRGAVSGLGLVTALAGLVELAGALLRRRPAPGPDDAAAR